LDLHPRAFPVGHCAQTHFAHAGALICLWDERPAFELVVRRSFADYLWQWLLTAARDMALGIEAPIGRSGGRHDEGKGDDDRKPNRDDM